VRLARVLLLVCCFATARNTARAEPPSLSAPTPAPAPTTAPQSTPTPSNMTVPTSTATTGSGEKPFETKDYVTLFSALTALIFSSLSLFQKRRETTASERKQLSEILSKLVDLNLQVATFNANALASGMPPNTPGILGDHRRFLVRQAAFLSQEPGLRVSSYEFLIIAWAFDEIDDYEQAEAFFLKAAQTNSDWMSPGLALRSYARFLYKQGDIEKARKQYEASVTAFGTRHDRARYYRGDTYARWAMQELSSDIPHAQLLFDKGEAEFNAERNTSAKQRHLEGLAAQRTKGIR